MMAMCESLIHPGAKAKPVQSGKVYDTQVLQKKRENY